MGRALRGAPRIRIGEDIFAFPPGTTYAEAKSVLDEAIRAAVESLS